MGSDNLRFKKCPYRKSLAILGTCAYLMFCLPVSPLVFAFETSLAWDANVEADLGGYRVHHGTSTGSYTTVIDVGNQTAATVRGLGAGAYYFAVTAYDSSGNESTYSNEVTSSFSDTAPPVISAITASTITNTGASITWTTDETATSLVEYGPTAAYGSSSALGTALVTSHNRSLSALMSSTLYHYRVRSVDAASNIATSGDNTFLTAALPDTVPPAVSSLAISAINSTAATVTWTTNEGATSRVEYGLTSTYGSWSPLNVTLTTAHTISVDGLTPGSTYHIRAHSADAAGNASYSSDYLLTTLPFPDSVAPAAILNFGARGSDQEVVLTWTTPSDTDFTGTRIRYRTDRFPTSHEDGSLLGDFTGQPDQEGRATHVGVMNGVTYYYAAASYDASGNLQQTVYSSATPSSGLDPSGTQTGGCGMITPVDGNPPGPLKTADLLALLGVMIMMTIKRWLRPLRAPLAIGRNGSHHISPAGLLGMPLCRGASLTMGVGLLLLGGCGDGGTEGSANVAPFAGAQLAWEAPLTNSDGSDLVDLGGFRIYYGTVAPLTKTNGESIDMGNATGYTIERLEPGTYYFAVAAYDSSSNESVLSDTGSKTIY